MTRMTIMTKKRYPRARAAQWTVAEAKARFSEVVERARETGPQVVTRNGRDAVVVVSIDEWERKTRRVGSLVDFFAASPLRGSGVDVKRSRSKFRDVDL
jgi:prevent-host-death family protein